MHNVPIIETVANWGLYPKANCTVYKPNSIEELMDIVQNNTDIIARGNGRCYGDASLASSIVSTIALNKIEFVDEEQGIIICESGVLLSDLINVILPKGFFLPVTPGTKFITIGGAVASNVHGKNHHREGSFCDFVQWIDLISDDAILLRCDQENNATVFYNTCGGMGLTGIVTKVCMRLKKVANSYIQQKQIKTANLEETLTAFERFNHFTYSVAWIDCLAKGENLGRSLVLLGEHAPLTALLAKDLQNPLAISTKLNFSIPFYFPSFSLNKYTVKLFNFLYYHKARKKEIESIIDYDSFFYPLDAIFHWNKIYGKKGFVQYQFVIPKENGKAILKQILGRIAESGQASFLAVLKLFGKENSYSLLNFPMEGYTLALDFKVQDSLWPLLDELDEMVIAAGGRLYLTKDARMQKETFHKTYPAMQAYHADRFNSLQSKRLGITI
ncbi:MAG: FAD-binding oxidoreductase [Bacteroidota bacterium]